VQYVLKGLITLEMPRVDMFTEKFTSKGRLFSKDPLRWGEPRNRGLRVDLRQDVDKSLLDALHSCHGQVMHEDFNRLPQDLVTTLHHRKSSVGFSRGNFMNHIVLSCPLSKAITAPPSALVSPKASWGSKVSNPASLHGMDEVVSPLSHDHSSHLVLRGQVDHRKYRYLAISILDPHDVCLNSFSKLFGLLEGSR